MSALDPEFVDLTRFIAGRNEGLQALETYYPEVYRALLHDDYEVSGSDVVGRCHGAATLFLEISHRAGVVQAWLWDAHANLYVGPVYRVHGPLGAAVEAARHHVETVYAEDQLTAGVTRYQQKRLEHVFVTA